MGFKLIINNIKKIFKLDEYSIALKSSVAVIVITFLMLMSLIVTHYQMKKIDKSKNNSQEAVVSSLKFQTLSNSIAQSNASLMLYLLTADKDHKDDVENKLTRLNASFLELNKLKNQGEQYTKDIESISNLYASYINQADNLIEVRSNDSENFPALIYAEKYINPFFLEFNSLINNLIDNIDIYDNDENQIKLYKELVSYRYYWQQISSSTRLYILTRSEDMFINIKQYIDVLIGKINNREKKYKIDNLFLQDDINHLTELFNTYHKNINELNRILKSDNWRKDISLLKNESLPLFSQLLNKSNMVADIAAKNTEITLNDSFIRFKDVRDINLYILLFSLMLSIYLLYFLKRNIQKRFNKVFSAIENITSGDMNARVDISGNDEISKLAYMFDAMMLYLQHVDKQKNDLTEELRANSADLEFQKNALDEHAIVSITDGSGMITYVNKKFCDISMYKPDELIGSYHDIINSGFHADIFWRNFWTTITSGTIWKGQVCNRCKDGSLYWVDTTVIPYLDDDGLPERYVSIRNDITENKLMSEELESQNIILNAVSDIQSNFIRLHEPKKQFLDMLETICTTAGCNYGSILEVVQGDGLKKPILHAVVGHLNQNIDVKGEAVTNTQLVYGIFNRLNSDDPVLINNNLKQDNGLSVNSEVYSGLDNMAAISLINNEGLCGCLVLGNRVGGIEEDLIRNIKPLIATIENLIGANNNIMRRREAEKELINANRNLEQRVQERTTVLETTMTELEKEKQVLQSILEGTSNTYGSNVFVNLAKSAAEALKFSHVLVTEINVSKMTAKTLATYIDGNISENFEYDIKGTPCEKILNKTACIYQSGVENLFPDDLRLHNTGLQSYIGMPFLDLNNNVIGHIAVLDRLPLQDESWAISIVKIFASYVANEIKRQYSEKELIENENRLKHAIQFSNIGTWDWAINDDEVIASENISEILGTSVRQSEITFNTLISSLHHDDKDMVESAIYNCINLGNEFDIEHRVVWSDESVHWIHEKGNVSRDSEGKPERMLGLIQDITLRKNYQDQLEKAYKSKSEFLANMSHELRTPLNAIIGFSQAMLKGIDGPITDDQHESLELIHNAGKHLLLIISDILDMSKIEAGKMEVSKSDKNFKILISETLAMVKSLANEKGLEIIQNWQCENEFVSIDEMRMRQVLFNLLSNAIKFTEKGSVTISSKDSNSQSKNIPNDIRSKLTEQKDYIVVSVSDTGVGIEKEQTHKIFEEFRQVDGGSTKTKGGTGLGLPISKYLINLHGGEIWVNSVLGQGSVFSFIIPLSE